MYTTEEMASEQMKKVADSLTCHICYNLYIQGHQISSMLSERNDTVRNEECLAKLMVQSTITCPECRKSTLFLMER